jgi:hypothetical protein
VRLLSIVVLVFVVAAAAFLALAWSAKWFSGRSAHDARSESPNARALRLRTAAREYEIGVDRAAGFVVLETLSVADGDRTELHLALPAN